MVLWCDMMRMVLFSLRKDGQIWKPSADICCCSKNRRTTFGYECGWWLNGRSFVSLFGLVWFFCFLFDFFSSTLFFCCRVFGLVLKSRLCFTHTPTHTCVYIQIHTIVIRRASQPHHIDLHNTEWWRRRRLRCCVVAVVFVFVVVGRPFGPTIANMPAATPVACDLPTIEHLNVAYRERRTKIQYGGRGFSFPDNNKIMRRSSIYNKKTTKNINKII